MRSGRTLRNAGLMTAMLVLAIAGPAAVALQPRDGETVAAVFAPWTAESDAVRRVWAGGGLALATGGRGFVVIARDAGGDGAAAFRAKLRAMGAWAVLRGSGLGALCQPIDGARSPRGK